MACAYEKRSHFSLSRTYFFLAHPIKVCDYYLLKGFISFYSLTLVYQHLSQNMFYKMLSSYTNQHNSMCFDIELRLKPVEDLSPRYFM